MAELSFNALEGVMAGRTFYMTTMTLQMASRFFEPTPSGIPAEQRSQRELNERRIPDLVEYLLNRDGDWVFGSLTVSFDGVATFNDGLLELDPDTEFVIVDGQHRLAAIRRAIQMDPTLKKQQIGVMLIPFESLDRNQQVFSDLNRTVQKTSRSLDILYDHSDPLNGLVKALVPQVPLLEGRVEKNANSLSLRSPKFITLSALYDSCQQLLGGKSALSALEDDDRSEAALKFCVEYWNTLSDLVEPYRAVLEERIRPSDARIEYVVAHAVAFYALGTVGQRVLHASAAADVPPIVDASRLVGLTNIDWRRTNESWQGIVMLGPSVVTRQQTRAAMAKRICHLLHPTEFDDAARVLGD